MKRIARLFAFMPMLGGLLHADWKIVTRTGESSLTEYLKGSWMRTDSSPVYASVQDFDHRSRVNWRTDLRQYEVVDWPPAFPNDSSSGPVITIERNTTDTGERKQFFGRTARRLVTRVTRSDAPATTIDAWYIEAPGLPKWKRGSGGSFAILTMSVAGPKAAPPRFDVKQTGPAPEGLAVWTKMTYAVDPPGGSQRRLESVSEVTELVEGPLSDQVFQPPEGYQRVANLPYPAPRHGPPTWGEMLRAHWQMLENWFSTRFTK